MPALSASTRQKVVHLPTTAAAAMSEDALMLLARARNAAFAEAARGNLGHGLGILQDALQDEPMSHELLADMAALLLVAGRHEQAGACAERALAIRPDHGPSVYTLGFSLSGRGQTRKAIEVLSHRKGTVAQHDINTAVEAIRRRAMLQLVKCPVGCVSAHPHENISDLLCVGLDVHRLLQKRGRPESC